MRVVLLHGPKPEALRVRGREDRLTQRAFGSGVGGRSAYRLDDLCQVELPAFDQTETEITRNPERVGC